MLNKAILMGRLTKDPELRHTPQGTAVCSFGIAVQRNFAQAGQERPTDFINIVAWRATAEFVAKYFTKGKMIVVVGSIQSRTWEDQQGKKNYSTEVLAEEVMFGESKKDSEGGGRTYTPPANSYDNSVPSVPQSDAFIPIDTDDDLPF